MNEEERNRPCFPAPSFGNKKKKNRSDAQILTKMEQSLFSFLEPLSHLASSCFGESNPWQ